MSSRTREKRTLYERIDKLAKSTSRPKPAVVIGILFVIFGMLLLLNAYNNDIMSQLEIANFAILIVGVAMIFGI